MKAFLGRGICPGGGFFACDFFTGVSEGFTGLAMSTDPSDKALMDEAGESEHNELWGDNRVGEIVV